MQEPNNNSNTYIRFQANIHSFIESDDRVNIVLKYLDDAIAELDTMDSIVASYKIHLNVSSLISVPLQEGTHNLTL